MNSVMLKLGKMKFSISTAAYTAFKQSWAFNWHAQSRLQNTPAQQYSGQGTRSIDLQGTIYPPAYGSLTFVEDMAKEAAKGKPLLMVSGTGKIMHYWCVKNISEDNKHFRVGGTPRKISFSLKLEYYGENYR